MSEVFSLYAARDSRVHQLNPLTKGTLAGCLLIASLALPGIWAGYLLFLMVLLPLAWGAKVSPQLVGRSWRVVLPFAISVFLIQGFLWPGGTPLYGIGPISLKQEGLHFATASLGRILIIVSSFLWFALTTRPDHLMTALVKRGLPGTLAYLIVATIQIVPRFQARAATILDAQRSRGLEIEGRFFQRVRAVLPLVVPLILSSLVDVEERALAIEIRAFNHAGARTSLVEIGEADWEPALRWVAGLVTLAAFGVRFLPHGW